MSKPEESLNGFQIFPHTNPTQNVDDLFLGKISLKCSKSLTRPPKPPASTNLKILQLSDIRYQLIGSKKNKEVKLDN